MKSIVKGIALATVVAGAAVPSALAMRPGDGYAGAVTPNGVSVKAQPNSAAIAARHNALGQLGADQSDVFTRYVANHKTTPIPYLSQGVGVDASQFGGTGVAQVSARPDDRVGVRTSEPTSIVSVASPGNGFNWDDASVGFTVAGALFLLMTAGIYSSRRNGGRPRTA